MGLCFVPLLAKHGTRDSSWTALFQAHPCEGSQVTQSLEVELPRFVSYSEVPEPNKKTLILTPITHIQRQVLLDVSRIINVVSNSI